MLQYQVSFLYYNVVTAMHHTSFSMKFHGEIKRDLSNISKETHFFVSGNRNIQC